ncbi:hypothetical protein [Anaerotignum propionicum]|uniref:hypothetical protein n=1 Tax=Anaerotignum propionicum TaxID=28446 RepID=UPI002ED6A18F
MYKLILVIFIIWQIRDYWNTFFPFVWLWQSTVAGNKIVSNYRQQTLSWRVNDATANNACGITSKSHTHGINSFVL